MAALIELLLLAAGFFLLVKGAEYFVEGASALAVRFGISQLVIGLTIVAMGTSLPEASVSITAALRGSADVAVGNVLGSNILNILLILGLTAVLVPLRVERSTRCYELPFTIAISGILIYMGRSGGRIAFAEGVVLWLFFLAYLGYLVLSGGTEEAGGGEGLPLWRLLLYIVGGAAVVLLGSRLAVQAAVNIALLLEISERFIGLTIVALGTSLPELVTSLVAGLRGNADIAVGNIVGSNIFNILFVLGTSALIIPVPFQPAFLLDGWAALGSAVLLLLCACRGRLTRWGGLLLLACYGLYFSQLL